MKNIPFFSKPIKHSKNADPLLFLVSFTKCQREKNIEKTLFGSAGTQKVIISGFWDYFATISTESKKNISSKTYIYIKRVCLTFNWQKR